MDGAGLSVPARRRAPEGAWVPLFAMAWWGYWSGVQGAVAPGLAAGFGLSDAEVARALGWIGCSALGALLLGRGVDRVGRRRVLLACLAMLPVCAIATALAPGIGAYVAVQVVAWAFGTTLLSTVTVVLAESLSAGRRARGHGHAALVFTAATALPLVLAATLAGVAGSWRWVWAAAALPLVALPLARRALPETARWEAAAGRGETAATRLGDLFEPGLRKRAGRIVLAGLCVGAAETAVRTWLFYHAVRELELAPPRALLVLLVGGLVSLVGFRVAGVLADAVGRRLTFALGTTLAAVGAGGYYGLAEGTSTLVLGVAFAALATGGNVAIVAFRALATELFPTRLRGVLGGWLATAQAAGYVVAMLGAAALAPGLGTLGAAVLAVVLVAMPVAAALLAGLPETAGLELEASALEPEALRAPRSL